MKRKRFSVEQIVAVLKQADVGVPVAELIRQVGITEQTLYRVRTVYLGRTATSMQEALFRQEGKVYEPQMLLQPEDVASVIVHALMLPSTAEVTDVSIRLMLKT